jgi:hypothetical protein
VVGVVLVAVLAAAAYNAYARVLGGLRVVSLERIAPPGTATPS